jgi:hypothetical protein
MPTTLFTTVHNGLAAAVVLFVSVVSVALAQISQTKPGLEESTSAAPRRSHGRSNSTQIHPTLSMT